MGRRWVGGGLVGDEAEIQFEHSGIQKECEQALASAALLFASHATAATLAATDWNGQVSDDQLDEWASWPGEAVGPSGGSSWTGSGGAGEREMTADGEAEWLRQRLAWLDAQRGASEQRAAALHSQLERLATVLGELSAAPVACPRLGDARCSTKPRAMGTTANLVT